MLLNADVYWRLRFAGVASRLSVDLRGCRVDHADLGALAHSTMVLPAPHADVKITMSDVRDVVLARPPDVPIRIEVSGRVRQLRLDDTFYSEGKSGVSAESADWRDHGRGYRVLVAGGVDALTVRAGCLAVPSLG